LAITQAVADSFKTQLLSSAHSFVNLTGTNTIASVAAASGTAGPAGTATTVYTGTFTNGVANAYQGYVFTITAAATAANNGTYLCIASSATTITLCNPNGATMGTAATVSAVGSAWKIALYTATATMDKTTTAYSATNEVSSTNYVAGGLALVSTTPVLSTDTACCLFATASWTPVTFTTAGALIYNNTLVGQPSALILSFGGSFTATAGTFTVTFPAQTAGNAILGLA
jgi:hypothetical protein